MAQNTLKQNIETAKKVISGVKETILSQGVEMPEGTPATEYPEFIAQMRPESEFIELGEKISEIKDDLSELQSTVESHTNEIGEFNGVVTTAEEAIYGLNTKVIELDSEITDIDKRVTTNEEDISQNAAVMEALAIILYNGLVDTIERVGSNEKDITELQGKAATTGHEIEELKTATQPLTIQGEGNRFLADDGSYKEVIAGNYCFSGDLSATDNSFAFSIEGMVGVAKRVSEEEIEIGLSSQNSWTMQHTGSTAWNEVTYGNGIFVAVGNSGLTGCSTDGINWTLQTIGTNNLYDVIYTNGTFIAVGSSSTFLLSTDGITWTELSNGEETLYSVNYENGLFIVVGENGILMHSTDGINWTKQASENTAWHGITYGKGLFAIVGKEGSMAYSPDGINWTIHIVEPTINWYDITYAHGMFVAAGIQGYTAYSYDGINWTTQTNGSLINLWRGITPLQKGFLIVGLIGPLSYSPDGINWTIINSISVTYQSFFGVTSVNNKIIVVGALGSILYTESFESTIMNILSSRHKENTIEYLHYDNEIICPGHTLTFTLPTESLKKIEAEIWNEDFAYKITGVGNSDLSGCSIMISQYK